MEKTVRVSERVYSKKMADLTRGFEVSVTCNTSRILLNSRSIGSWNVVLRYGKPHERSKQHRYSNRQVISYYLVSRLLNRTTGDQLETVHVERQRAQAAYDLIDFYNQFSKGDTSRLDAMRKEGRAGRRQVAVVLRRLNTVAKEVDLPNSDKVSSYI